MAEAPGFAGPASVAVTTVTGVIWEEIIDLAC